MGRFTKFLQTEYKRAAVRLPGILLKAAIPVCIAGMAVFACRNGSAMSPKKNKDRLFRRREHIYGLRTAVCGGYGLHKGILQP